MLLYGLHDRQLERIIDWYTSRTAADLELATILNDEPEWMEQQLEIGRVDFSEADVGVERA